MMPKRLRKEERHWVYLMLVERDGEQCRDCKLTSDDLIYPLEIDHQDEDKTNWEPANLALRCKSCNVAKQNRARTHSQLDMFPASQNGTPRLRVLPPESAGDTLGDTAGRVSKSVCVCDPNSVCVCDRTPGSPNAKRRRQAIDHESGTPEMRANGFYEDTFRRWLVDYVKAHGTITRRDALNAGAELTGGSPMTMRRYLDKLTSLVGPLKETKDESGIAIIVSRFGED